MFVTPSKDKNHSADTYIQPQLEVGSSDDEYEKEANDVAHKVMRMSESEQMPKMSTENESIQMMRMDEEPIKMAHHNEGKIQMMVDNDYTVKTRPSEALDSNEERDAGTEPDPEKENLIEKHRRKKAEKHIRQGEELIFNIYTDEFPYRGKKGTALKLKRRWVKKKFWPYYAQHLEDKYGFPKINSWEEFLALEDKSNKTSADFFNIAVFLPVIKSEPQSVKEDTDIKEDEKKQETVIVDEEKKTDTVVDEPKKTPVKITQHNERKVINKHYEPIANFNNADNIGQNVKGRVELDPNKDYVVFIKGVAVKDKVTVFVGGNRVSGDTDFRSGRRSYPVPPGSDHVEVLGETINKDSYLEIEIHYAKQQQTTKWRTIKTTYYSDGSSNTETIEKWENTIEVPFQTRPGLNSDLFFQMVGEPAIIWQQD